MRFLDAVDQTLEILATSPNIGTSIASDKHPKARYQSVLGFTVYLVFYESDEEALLVLRVIHGNRDLPSVIKEH